MDQTLLDYRKERDTFFADSSQSPLGPGRHDFSGLSYFDENPDLVFTLTVEPDDAGAVQVGTTDGAERTYHRAGLVRFQVRGEEAKLRLFSTGHPGLFLPFRDATSGKQTYGAGRYLDLEQNSDGTITIDFNYAYSPFCAYNEAYSCPLPPFENWLSVPIEAGETFSA